MIALDLGIKLTIQNLRMRFEKSHLGIVWFFIEPLVFISIFYLVFSKIMVSHIEHFAFYLCIGMIPWTFIASSLTDASRSLLIKKNLIMNVAIDVRVIPFSSCLAHGVGFCVSFVVLFLVMILWKRVPIGLCAFITPLIMLAQIVFCYGLSLLLSIVSILVRDIMYAVHLFLMMWFYATPIFYTKEMVPAHLRWVVDLNPMTFFVDAYRTVIIHNELISAVHASILLGCALCAYLCGNYVFQSQKKKIAKEL